MTITPENRARRRWSEGRRALGLPATMEGIYDAWHRPFLEAVAEWHAAADGPLTVGLQGC